MRKDAFGRTLAVALAVLAAGCASHLREAKEAYAAGQDLARAGRTVPAIAAYKRAAVEAGLETRARPSAQAFMVKGLAEVKLELWQEAEKSFLRAFGLGFEDGEGWAADAALFGLAVSFDELGFPGSAAGVYERLLTRSPHKPVKRAAAQRFVDLTLSRSLALGEKEKERTLAGLVKTIERLETDDYACGLYHYYHAQVESHRGDYRRSYDEAVIARELGVGSEDILRDNDNQIVFCYDRITALLSPEERDAFTAGHVAWTKKWGWKDARTPGWKQE
jgi:tetratricopeptide (TPR) repeat protein